MYKKEYNFKKRKYENLLHIEPKKIKLNNYYNLTNFFLQTKNIEELKNLIYQCDKNNFSKQELLTIFSQIESFKKNIKNNCSYIN